MAVSLQIDADADGESTSTLVIGGNNRKVESQMYRMIQVVVGRPSSMKKEVRLGIHTPGIC